MLLESIIFQRGYANDHIRNPISESSIDITSLSQSGHNDVYSLTSKLVAEPLITKAKDRVAETSGTNARGYNCVYWNHETCLC